MKSSADKAYNGVSKGAYVASPAGKEQPDAILIATGSEVGLALDAQKALEKDGINTSVVSMPSWDRFEKQSPEYKESILPKSVKKRLAIEMGSPLGWIVTLVTKVTSWPLTASCFSSWRKSDGRVRIYNK